MNGHVQEQLSAYLDDALPALERRAVEAHLGSCAECASHLEDLARIDEAVRTLPAEPPEGYFESLPGRVRARLRPRPVAAPSFRTWAAVAALVIFALTPLIVLRQGRTGPETQAPSAAYAPRVPPASEAQASSVPPQAAPESPADTLGAKETARARRPALSFGRSSPASPALGDTRE